MNLSTLAGNNQIKQQLAQQAAGRGLSHAYIIWILMNISL